MLHYYDSNIILYWSFLVIHCLQVLNVTQLKNDSVRVECKFLQDCIVNGCQVVFILQKEVVYSIDMYKTQWKEETILQYFNLNNYCCSGYYTVNGYDLVNGTIFDDVVAASIDNLRIVKLNRTSKTITPSSCEWKDCL